MSITQSKLARYIGVERPHILTALGLLPDDPTPLDQLWEVFAQLAATGTVGEGKTLSLVDALPATGDENTYYGLTAQIETGQGPVTNPQAGEGINAFMNFNPDLSSVVIGGSGTSTMTSDRPPSVIDMAWSAAVASSVLDDVTEGENSIIIQIAESSESIFFVKGVFIDDNDGTVVAGGVSYPRGYYVAEEENSTDFQPAGLDEETFSMETEGKYTFDQNAIDAGFYTILTAFSNLYKRGIYDFDGANFNLQLDLTDFSAKFTESELEISSLRSDVEDLMAWKQEVESAAGTANGGT